MTSLTMYLLLKGGCVFILAVIATVTATILHTFCWYLHFTGDMSPGSRSEKFYRIIRVLLPLAIVLMILAPTQKVTILMLDANEGKKIENLGEGNNVKQWIHDEFHRPSGCVCGKCKSE